MQRVRVVEQEGEGRKWGFMAFLKEKRTEIQGLQTSAGYPSCQPTAGRLRAHVCTQVSIWNAAWDTVCSSCLFRRMMAPAIS